MSAGERSAHRAATVESLQKVRRLCQELGLLVRPLINMCVISPPLVITRDQIDRLVEILHKGIASTMDDLVRERLWVG